MQTIYLSPHLDDVALSCGGFIWEQTKAGEAVEIWTICAGFPPDDNLSPYAKELHHRWGGGRDATKHRRKEDIKSCGVLGVPHRHFEIPDAIYRRDPKSGKSLYDSEEAIFGGLSDSEKLLIQSLVSKIAELIPVDTILVSPITIGNHVDHQLTRIIAERLDVPISFYADYPYIEDQAVVLNALLPPGYHANRHPVSMKGLEAWQDSIAAYKSQISTFWEDEQAMRKAITKYHSEVEGIPLWY
jgi:LmbE family N-acetylglucosaminyl deacetylase